MRKTVLRLTVVLFLILNLFSLGACNQINITTEVTWKDTDGTVLNSSHLLFNQSVPEFSLPADTEIWDYTGWAEETNGNSITYTACRTPQNSYFIGNVFQIVTKDLDGRPLSTGTGFIYNNKGYFVTNSHVMEDAYYATAIFEIRNEALSESYTNLEIEWVAYNNSDKDIFVGKVTNYSSISSYYKEFNFVEDYETGDTTYSVGYPNSSVGLEVNQGEITNSLSTLYDKLYSGVSYIGSTSYVAPGSSGGVLLNENLDVLGMTTLAEYDNAGRFVIGASIITYNYNNIIKSITYQDFKDLATTLHPDESTFIRFFKDFISSDEVVRVEENGKIYYKVIWKSEDTTSDGVTYNSTLNLYITSDMYIDYYDSASWSNNHERYIEFCGYYSKDNGLNDFQFHLTYIWDADCDDWYVIESDNINYNENISATLNYYDSYSSSTYTINDINIEYAKNQFNFVYKLLWDWISNCE